MRDTCFLIHSGDASQWAWKAWEYWHRKHWKCSDLADTVFLSEEINPHFEGIECEQTGKGNWAEQFLRYLNRCPYKTIIYAHEDYFEEENSLPHILEPLLYYFNKTDCQLLKCCGWWAGSPDWDKDGTFIDTGTRLADLNNEIIWKYNNDRSYLL